MYKGTLEDVVRSMYQVEKKLDAVNPVAVKKKFDDRKDKDIDNDGDVDSSDKYLHKRRKAISKAVKDEEVEVKEMRPQGKTHFQAFNKRREMGIKSDPKKAKAAMANIFKKKNVQSQKKDDVEINPKVDDMREKVQVPDKMTKKLDKIVKSLKKSVKGHAKQAQTIGKLASMDKVDEISKDTLRSYSTKASDASRNKNIPVHKKDNRVAGVKKAAQRLGEKHMGPHVSTGRKMTDAEMKKREDIKKGLMKSKSDFKDRYGKDADQVMNALATKKAMEAKEDVIRRGDAKVVKVKGPDGRPMFKKMKPVVKVDDPRDHAMRSEETITEAEMNYRVSIEGLPDFFVAAKNPGEVKIKMRKMLKKPDMLNKVTRVPDAAMKKHFRLKAQGKDDDEQQPMKEETVMSEDNTNPLVKAVSEILSRNSFNAFRSVKPIQEKEMKSADSTAQAAGGVQDKGAKKNQANIVTMKQKDQETDIKQGASTLHMCAKNVMHEKYGRGECLFGMHAEPDENGHVSHYDIMFNHGIEKDMPISECEVLYEREHGDKMHKMKKKPKKDEDK